MIHKFLHLILRFIIITASNNEKRGMGVNEMRALLTNESIDRACEEIGQYLSERKTESRELLRVKLGAEEALLFYQKAFGADAEFRLDTGGRFGRGKVRLTVPGDSADPFTDSEYSSDEDALMRSAMISMGKMPRWRYRRGANEVLYTAEKKSAPDWARLLIAIAAAVVLGLLVRLSQDSFRFLLQEGIIAPLISTFLGFLNAVAGPMIFLSVVWGIYSIGDAATFSQVGKRLGRIYGLYLFLTMLISVLCSLPFFTLRFGAAHGAGDFSALYRMVLDIIPSNLFTPFSRGNTLQILFVAIIVGIAMLLIGKNTQSVADLSEQLGYIVNGIMGIVGKLVPFFVFGSLFNIIASSEFGALAVGGKFFFGTIAACAVMIVLHVLVTCLRHRITPLDLWRRTFSTFLISITTASSSAAFADNLQTCVEKLGVSRRIANFGVPFGQILYKPAVSALFWYAAVSVAESSGIEMSMTWVVTALVMATVLSAAAPPVPGGMSASFAILFSQLGLPMEELAVILSLSSVLDFVVTASNIFCAQNVLAVSAGNIAEE